jgi:hypothetical protein
MTALLLIASAPTKIKLFLPVYKLLATYWPLLWFRLACAVVAILFIFVFEIVEFFRPRVKVLHTPSAGPSVDIVLKVTNQGRDGIFWATAEIAGGNKTNYINHHPSDRTVDLKWENQKELEVPLQRNASKNLEIGRVEKLTEQMEELRLFCFSDDGARTTFGTAKWDIRQQQQQLPSFRLRVSVFCKGSRKPLVKYFMVGPKTSGGPLEMLEVPA